MGKRFMKKGKMITVGGKHYTGFRDVPKIEITDSHPAEDKKKSKKKRAEQKRDRKKNRK